MKENEKMIEVTGWHAWCDGDGVKKVDRFICLSGDWHYHVIENEDGVAVDMWSFDSDNHSDDPIIFEKKADAIAEDKRMDDEYKMDRDARLKKEDAEDAPLVAKLNALPIARVTRIVEKAQPRFSVIGQCTMEELRTNLEAVKIFFAGGVTTDENAFIPLGAIDHVYVSRKATCVVTKANATFIFPGAQHYNAIHIAMRIFSR